MVTVSVALATYNGREYIDGQFASLADQQQPPEELVVTDDGSTDDTVARIEAFSAAAPFPVRLHRNAERLGYRANFIKAAGACESELIAFCDQDDVWEPQKLARCVAAFADPEVLLVYHDALTVTGEGQPIAPLQQLPAPRVSEALSSHPMDYALGFTQVFRRSLLDLSGWWPQSLDHKEVERQERMAHDQWFFFLASVFGSIIRIDEQLVRYRQHGGNSYGWTAPSRIDALRWSLWPSFRGRVEQYRALEAGAGRRAAILADMGRAVTSEWRSRAELAAERYRGLEILYRERGRLYESISPIERAAAFHAILANRGYRRKGEWGLGGRAMVADFCLGLPAGHRISAVRKTGRD